MKTKIIRLFIIAATALVVFKLILLPVWITGQSMEPTYHDGHFVFVNRLAYLRQRPARGDVVAIRMSGVSVMYLKRLIALPGETVRIDNGIVKINDQPLTETYLVNRADWQVPAVTLGLDEFYVIGDNRSVKVEEHLFGRVEYARIIGRVLW